MERLNIQGFLIGNTIYIMDLVRTLRFFHKRPRSGVILEGLLLNGSICCDRMEILKKSSKYGDKRLMKFQNQVNYGAKEAVSMLNCMIMKMLRSVLRPQFTSLLNMEIPLSNN